MMIKFQIAVRELETGLVKNGTYFSLWWIKKSFWGIWQRVLLSGGKVIGVETTVLY